MSRGNVFFKRVMVLLLSAATVLGCVPSNVYASEVNVSEEVAPALSEEVPDLETISEPASDVDLNQNDESVETPVEEVEEEVIVIIEEDEESEQPAEDGEEISEEIITEEILEEDIDEVLIEDEEIIEEEVEEEVEEEEPEEIVIPGEAPEGYTKEEYVEELTSYYGDDIMKKIESTLKNPSQKNVIDILNTVLFSEDVKKDKKALLDENGNPLPYTTYVDECDNHYAIFVDKDTEQIKVIQLDENSTDYYEYPDVMSKKEVDKLIKQYGEDDLDIEEVTDYERVILSVTLPDPITEVWTSDIQFYQGEDDNIILLNNYSIKVGNKTYQTKDGSLKLNDDMSFYYVDKKGNEVIVPCWDEDENSKLKCSPLDKNTVKKLLTTYEDIDNDLWFAGYEFEDDYKEVILGYNVGIWPQPYYELGTEFADLRNVKVPEKPVEEDGDFEPIEKFVPIDVQPIDDPTIGIPTIGDPTIGDPVVGPVIVPSFPIDDPIVDPGFGEDVPADLGDYAKPHFLERAKNSETNVVPSVENYEEEPEAVTVPSINIDNFVSASNGNVLAYRELSDRDFSNQHLLANAAAAKNGKSALILNDAQMILNINDGSNVSITFKNVLGCSEIGSKVKAVCWNETDLDYVIEGIVTGDNQVTFDNFIARSLTNVTIYIEY